MIALPESGKGGADLQALNGCSALGTSLGSGVPSLSLSLRICGFPVKVILQTQQRLKEGERGEGGELWHGREETE